jgi:hypothetical protein
MDRRPLNLAPLGGRKDPQKEYTQMLTSAPVLQTARRPARWVVTLVMAGLLLAAAPALQAQDPSAEERIQSLEEALSALRAELEAMKAEKAAEAAQQAAEQAAEQAVAEAAEGEAAEVPGDRLAELERRLDLLAAELERLDLGEAAAEAPVSEKGFGPAASKVYRTDRGISIGGYGEMLYQSPSSERDDGTASGESDQLDFLRAVFYFGYKFNDRLLFNSEIELEHASTDDEGEVSVEFAYLDYLLRPQINVRAGLLLIPMGFINELHEPPVYLGARRPDVERAILPSTWRENGFGLFGDVGSWTYRTYVVNGLDASGFSAGGIRGGRQRGSEAAAEDFAWVGRLDYTGRPGLLVGGSLYSGGSGQGLAGPGGKVLDVDTTIYEAHLEWKWRGLEVRALAARSELDDVAALNQTLGLTGDRSVGEEMGGWYLQLGYDVLNHMDFRGTGRGEMALIPYARFESYDTQSKVPAGFLRDPAREVSSFTLGLAFKPIDEVILKADYQNYDNEAGTALDQFNVALGYLF